MSFDIIGDVHGMADELKALLQSMGYSNANGAYRHTDRQAIFVGDLIDRGPENIETVEIVKAMVDAGSALIVMGNHEYNAICYHTSDGDGGFLRKNSNKNTNQHKAFLDEYSALNDGGMKLRETIDWFKTLPIYLEVSGIRIIHACWHENSLEVMREGLNSDNSMPEHLFLKTASKGSPEYMAIEILLKGMEASLPAGIVFSDKDGNKRSNTRLKWWLQSEQTFKSASIIPKDKTDDLPNILISKECLISYKQDKNPVFFGHYWMEGEPVLQSDNICCTDYSVCKSGGRLCAYRWSGETRLIEENFFWVK